MGERHNGDAASSGFGRFMQILITQTYVGTITQMELVKGVKDQVQSEVL